MTKQRSTSDATRRVLSQTTKALSAERDVEISFGGAGVSVAAKAVRVPAPPRKLTADKLALSRGRMDRAAIRIAHHDEDTHAQHVPQNGVGSAAFSALEEVRLEGLARRRLRGVGNNIGAAVARDVKEKGLDRIEDRQDVPWPEIVSLVAREVVFGADIPSSAAAIVEKWRPELVKLAGGALDALANDTLLEDQGAFAEASLKVLEALGVGDDTATNTSADEETPENEGSEPEGSQDQPDSIAEEKAPSPPPELESEATAEDTQDDAELRESKPADVQDQHGEPVEMAPLEITEPTTNEARYNVYTRQFDEVGTADQLCDPNELARLRQSLDGQLEPLQTMISRLANRLQRRLLAQQKRSWQFDLDEGMLDAGRLARVVVDPMQPLSFMQEKSHWFRDTVFSLLIDNSGSMRGRPITVAALCADILARTLERCGVRVEILGFTTRAWKGGKSRERWVEDGRPRAPGRLNDLRHIVYKQAETPWRRSKINLGLMLKEGLLKENIDGEALLWAHDRLLTRREERRILMVISDGAPVDDTTSSTNGAGYLEAHLRDVIAMIENKSPVELFAIGIGHDVTRFYRRAITIADIDQLGSVMMEQLEKLFEADVRGYHKRERRGAGQRAAYYAA